jgi:hypothetical protein
MHENDIARTIRIRGCSPYERYLCLPYLSHGAFLPLPFSEAVEIPVGWKDHSQLQGRRKLKKPGAVLNTTRRSAPSCNPDMLLTLL